MKFTIKQIVLVILVVVLVRLIIISRKEKIRKEEFRNGADIESIIEGLKPTKGEIIFNESDPNTLMPTYKHQNYGAKRVVQKDDPTEKGYNLNAILKGWGEWREGRDKKLKNFCSNKEKLLSCKYYDAHGEKYDILKFYNMIKDQLQDKFGDDILVMHVRVGDVLTRKDLKDIYYKPVEFYKSVKIPKTVKEVYVYAGSHNISDSDKLRPSAEHLMKIKELLEKRGYKVKFMLGDNADKGLISMGKASYFMKGGGGYSDLIGEIVKMNGGEVL